MELDKEAALQKAIVRMIDEGFIESAKDCTEGGIAVTLAECGFANGIGAQVDLVSGDLAAEFVLFGEDASRIVISCNAKSVERIKQVALQFAISAEQVGITVPEELEIRVDGKVSAAAAVADLKEGWANALVTALDTEIEEQAVSGAV